MDYVQPKNIFLAYFLPPTQHTQTKYRQRIDSNSVPFSIVFGSKKLLCVLFILNFNYA